MLLHFLNNSLAVAFTRVPEVANLGLEKGEAPPFLYYAAGLLLAAVALAFYLSRARLVPAGDEPAWRPSYPGVALPPPGSNTRVEAPAPPLASVAVVLLALGSFAAAVVVTLQRAA
jgi:hypothetical protein